MNRILRILTAFFVISTIGISLSYAETIWDKRQKASQGIGEKQESIESASSQEKSTSPIPLDEIIIPNQYGSIIETHEGTNGKLIIHIQDAHANYEAQKNIAGIVEILILDHNLELILREGGSTNANFSHLRSMASLDARKKAADKLLMDATIAGEDYLEISSDYPMVFQGIEDRALYDENRGALWEMDKFKDAASEYVNKLILAADSIKAKLYNQDLLALDKDRKDYENEDADLLAYYKSLYAIMQKRNIDTAGFPNFSNLIKINELEQKIDFTKINDKTATDEENAVYDEYQASLRKLNVSKLFKEEPLIENKIQEAVSENSDQKTLYRISKALSIMDKMLNVKLVPEEYSYFLENKTDFDAQKWSDFLKKKSNELGLDLKVSEDYYAVKDNMPTIEKFYATAGERDNVFIKKSEERMKKDNIESAILIAGGFHTPNLTQLLTEKDYSYIVISPKVLTKTDDNIYRQTLKRTWLPEK
ncbi:MAG: hypothetical protein KKB22_07880 [Candidatus Omnitrophica bacterium]|nr:hypothetical protein [Candidatus Omnitrophota bacterium]